MSSTPRPGTTAATTPAGQAVPSVHLLVLDDHRFRAMGTDCHVQVVDGPPGACDLAEAIVREDERRWSRFLPDSELSWLNGQAGTEVETSSHTASLLERAVDAHATTAGWFDPLVGRDVVDAGYAVSFDDLGPRVAARTPTPRTGPARLAGRRWFQPVGSLLDLGGIAKGHTADRVAAALLAAGAAGVCVNIGGDLRAGGEAPDADGWFLAVDHRPELVIGVRDGGIATSTTTRRRWTTVDDDTGHHLIDPHTQRPSTSPVASATVIAGDATTAEVLAKVLVLAPLEEAVAICADHRAAGLATASDGTVHRVGPVDDYIRPIGGR